MKCKYSDIKSIYDWCEKYATTEDKQLLGKQASSDCIAYYTPSNANWCYMIEIVKYNGNLYKAITVFGEIKAVQPLNVQDIK